MAFDRARSTKPPARRPRRVPSQEPESDLAVPLRLTVARGALGMELYESAWLGPLEVLALALSLPGLKFPLDLSGGVGQFRHRRGQLERLELRSRPESIARGFERGASDVMGELARPVTAWLRPGGL